ncbi:flagellar basal body rod modification protein [Enterococcus lemanii]|uniref:Flagellar basal body rod modification protein n=1 Tax=Enterococcus lemanii TaxID=1159752 RepID=A0ABV9MXP7_9ENTE|nr:flagellar basal body rod modification protein [Enterococcus lemanii]MBM7708061.1 flagellar basal-body rod modification protein FlgD [Enterococcus lemanii]
MPSEINALNNARTIADVQRQKSDPSDISMDDFLKILSASMSNPTVMGGDSGGSGGNAGTDYIGQFIQFTSLQQMKEIGDAMSTSLQMNQQQQAFDMIGRTVTVEDQEGQASGKVEKVKFVNGYATIVVSGKEYYMSAIQEVGERE